MNAVSRAFGVFAAGLIVLSIGVVCQMVFVRAVLGQSSIWQTEFAPSRWSPPPSWVRPTSC